MAETKVTIDLTRIDDKEFAPDRPLRVAAVRGGKILDQKTVTPAKERDPRKFQVKLNLGPEEDGVSAAEVVVAPADDERNVFSKLAARRFVSVAGERSRLSDIIVLPGIYNWWRFCWFPRSYRITGRVLRHVDNCTHPIGGATVEIYDVDYCWWWYDEDLLRTGVTDANGFFDITFTWCVPLWCLLEVVRKPPLLVDPDLRDRLRAVVTERVPIKFPPPPPPPDPWEWEKQLFDLGFDLPARGKSGLENIATRQVSSSELSTSRAMTKAAPFATSFARNISTTAIGSVKDRINAAELFRPIIFWPPCDEPCDWLPDIKIRVTQTQPSGTVVIYEDRFFDIHFNEAGDILNLTLQANANAIYADDCHPDPILGNCMLLDAVGTIKIMPTVDPVTLIPDPDEGIYQPDVTAGVSYGVTPDRRQRLGYVKNYDRPWASSQPLINLINGTISVYGRFGIAANVDYYQIQVAKWSNADLLAWDVDHTHVPPDAAFVAVPGDALSAFSRSYLEESPLPQHWPSETFGPNTVSTIPLLWKSRERFEQEYRNTHGGNDPAPSFGGWYWSYFTETRLFDLISNKMSNGYYTFRLVCYRQTGVDGSGNPILVPVNMGLPGGVGRRCNSAKPELLTLYLHDDKHIPECEILEFTKNGTDVVDECAMVTLTPSDWLEVKYKAYDDAGHLDSYSVTLQKGFGPQLSLDSLAGVTSVPGGSVPEGPTYANALVDPTPAVPPYWFGGIWTKKIPYSTFVSMGGSCAYNLRLIACDRHTNGFTSACGLGGCEDDRAFTIILA